MFRRSFAADQSVVTEYGYDAEGHITSETRNILTAPPTVERVQPSFVRKGAQRELTLTGQNLRGATITTDAADIGIVSVIYGATTRVVLSLPETVVNGIHALNINTALGSTTASFEVRSPLPDLLARPLPLDVVVGGGTQLMLSLTAATDIDVTVSMVAETEGVISLSSSTLSLSSGQVVFPAITITGLAIGHTVLRVSTDDLADLELSVQVLSATGSKLPANARGENYTAKSSRLGVMNGQPAVPAARESAVVVTPETELMNGPVPGHLLPEKRAAFILGLQVGVSNGTTPEHLMR